MLTGTFLISLSLSLIMIPIIRKFSPRLGAVAPPRPDRWHSKSTPKIGGAGIFFAFVIPVLLVSCFIPPGHTHWPLLAGATLIFVLGLIDDFKQISPPAKLVGEIIAAAIVVFSGRNIDFFADDFINILVTFFWLVGITNAINLLDNMDGLAGGVSLIAAILLSYLFWKSGTTDLLVISLALAGGLLGFLVFNFPPASIFMGDSGALFLGFTLSGLAIARVPRASDLLAVMGVPTLLFLLPILDTTLVTVTRILRGQSPAKGGKDHTSHRLIAFGLTERQAVLILYGVAIIAGILGVVLESIDYTISLILIPILMITLALLTAYLGRLKIIAPGSYGSREGYYSSLMIGLTYRGRILEIGLDLFLISIAYYLAYWIHFGTLVNILELDIFLNSLPLALAGTYAAFFFFGLYRGVWQYLDIRDLVRYIKAVVGAVLLTAILMSWIYYPLSISLRIFVIFAILLLLGLVITRSSFTILDRIYNRQIRDPLSDSPILIYGAGEAGVLLLQWLSQDVNYHFNPVGFLDDDPFKLGREILGIHVLGNSQDLENILTKNKVDGILLSSENILNEETLETMKEVCQTQGIWLKSLHIEFDPIE
jgi:UDP-GlcNAc:undecaprenyl-phosphate GlcNAc-1-phosphate transferase